MKELKYVKTFEQFGIKEEEIVENNVVEDKVEENVENTEDKVDEGLFTGTTADEINKFVEKHKENLAKLIKKIHAVFGRQLSKKGQDRKKQLIDKLDINGAIKLLKDTAASLAANKNAEVPVMGVKGGQLVVGKPNKTGRVGGKIGSNA